jgi:hypothetical protein
MTMTTRESHSGCRDQDRLGYTRGLGAKGERSGRAVDERAACTTGRAKRERGEDVSPSPLLGLVSAHSLQSTRVSTGARGGSLSLRRAGRASAVRWRRCPLCPLRLSVVTQACARVAVRLWRDDDASDMD